MVTINLNFNNFSGLPTLLEVFGSFDNNYEYTAEGIFRRKAPPFCPRCSSPMVHNGYNIYTKKGLGDIKIGRYKCSNCNCTPEENRSFWEGLKSVLFDSLDDFVRLLRSHNVSYEGISAVMDFIYPRSKSTILREFSKNMEQEMVSHDENVLVVCYDEQHPKKGRCQKYRLTLFDPKTQRPLADELFDDNSSETIKNFLKKHLDTSEPVFIVTDFDKRYPEILREVFGDKLVHQYCLMHLNKLVVHDFPRKNNFEELMRHIKTFDEAIQKRLRMINSHWLNLTLFHYLPGAPATNNPVESYFSKSLRTDSKKQFRTDIGIENQIKLAEMKRAGKLTKPDKSLLELFRIFMPFRA